MDEDSKLEKKRGKEKEASQNSQVRLFGQDEWA
jgi:hypothetical protein